MQETITNTIELAIVKIAGNSIFQAGNAWGLPSLKLRQASQCKQFGYGRNAGGKISSQNQSLAGSSGLLE